MKGEVLEQYTEARLNERLHLFLKFPDLRRSFQEIDRKDSVYHGAPRAKPVVPPCSLAESAEAYPPTYKASAQGSGLFF